MNVYEVYTLLVVDNLLATKLDDGIVIGAGVIVKVWPVLSSTGLVVNDNE